MNTLFGKLPLLLGMPGGAGGAGAAPSGGSGMVTIFTFGIVILIFYFLIIRPQNKRQKETKAMLAAVKKGDRVATSGGIRGTVVSVRDDSVVLKVDSQTKLEFSKSAVSQILDGVETKTTPKKKVEEEVAEEIEEDETDEVATDDEES